MRQTMSDGSLLRRFRSGSQSAASELYLRYVSRLRRLAQTNLPRGLAQRVDAEDIVQSAFRRFLGAVRKGNYDLPGGEDLWSLLVVITLNRIRTERASQHAAKRDVRRTTDIPPDMPAGRQGSRINESSQLMRLLVREALDALPAHHRAVVELRMQDFEVAEIAQRVARSKRTVERILQEARDQLRTWIEDEEAEDDRVS